MAHCISTQGIAKWSMKWVVEKHRVSCSIPNEGTQSGDLSGTMAIDADQSKGEDWECSTNILLA